MSKKKPASKETVMEFLRAIYGEYTTLAVASFDEESVLKEATRLINKLSREEKDKP